MVFVHGYCALLSTSRMNLFDTSPRPASKGMIRRLEISLPGYNISFRKPFEEL